MTRLRWTLAAAVLGGVLAASGCGGEAQAPQIRVEEMVIMAPLAGRNVTAGYLEVVNEGAEADRLTAATIEGVGRVELHETEVDPDGVARMRQVEGMTVLPGGSLVLQPGGKHLMLFEVEVMEPGQSRAVTLQFDKAGPVEAVAEVKAR